MRHNRINLSKVTVGKRVFMRNSFLGDYSYIGNDCVLNNTCIGNYTCIADGVQIGGMEHPYWDISMSPLLSEQFVFGKITSIGHDVWIAAGCIIKQGITIGDGAVVGANSFVTKDVPPYAIVFGTPAKIYKFRFEKSVIEKTQKSEFWKYSPKKARAILNELRIQMHE